MILETKNAFFQRLKKEKEAHEIKNKIKNLCKSYDSIYASLLLPFDQELHKKNVELFKIKKRIKPHAIIVLGIGGSNLGTIAIQEAINGRLYNEFNHPKIYFVDNIDPEYSYKILNMTRNMLKQGKRVLLNVVSKSGNTTEIISNFEIFLSVLIKYDKFYRESIIITTDKNSKLWELADKEGFDKLLIPTLVGGRYSVFATATFPLLFLGINTQKLLKGARDAVKDSLYKKESSAVKGAIAIYNNYLQDKKIHDLFLFSNDLEYLGKWNRQLVAESLGKKYDVFGQEKITGITPTVSIGTTDLHSMAQLYLAGPKDKLVTFLKIQKHKEDIIIPNHTNILPDLHKKKMSMIMDSVFQGITMAFKKDKRPIITITLKQKDEEEIGYFMQYKMIETIILGRLLQVNPFDQPNVEDYKREARAILKKLR